MYSWSPSAIRTISLRGSSGCGRPNRLRGFGFASGSTLPRNTPIRFAGAVSLLYASSNSAITLRASSIIASSVSICSRSASRTPSRGSLRGVMRITSSSIQSARSCISAADSTSSELERFEEFGSRAASKSSELSRWSRSRSRRIIYLLNPGGSRARIHAAEAAEERAALLQYNIKYVD